MKITPVDTIKLSVPRLKKPEQLMLLLIGATMRIDIYLLGRLALAEVLCVLTLVLFSGKLRQAFKRPGIQTFFRLLGLWLFAIILSDLYNATELGLFLRGAARPVMIGVMFVAFLVLLWDHPQSLIFFIMGLVLAGLQNVIVPTDFRAEGLDDSGSYAYFAFVYTPLLLALSAFVAWFVQPLHKLAAASILLLAAVASFENFSRTTSATLMVASLLVIFGRKLRLNMPISRRNSSLSGAITRSFFAVILLYALTSIYVGLALDGFMGDRIFEKVQSQTSRPTDYPILNMFLTGRHYNISNYLMITDSPIFGSGSWPVTGNYDYLALTLVDADISLNFLRVMDTRRGTGHSILLGNWANYGPLSVPFWIYVSWGSLRLFRETFSQDRRLFSALSVFLIVFIFSIFFNNLNSLNRSFAAIVPVLVLVYAERRRNKFASLANMSSLGDAEMKTESGK